MNTAALRLFAIKIRLKLKPRCAPCGAERVVLVIYRITHHPNFVKVTVDISPPRFIREIIRGCTDGQNTKGSFATLRMTASLSLFHNFNIHFICFGLCRFWTGDSQNTVFELGRGFVIQHRRG